MSRTMMKKKYSIIFDMDGTLIDSSFAMTQSVNHVRNTLGLEPINQQALEYYINQPDQHFPVILYESIEYKPEHRELFREHYMKHSVESIALYPDVKEMLAFLSQKAHLAIATNASDFFARHMLEHLEILDYFDAIVGGNNVDDPKPNPQMIESLMESLESKRERTFLVGDSLKDEHAALNAKIGFIFAKWGYGKSDTATIRMSSVKELESFFKAFI